MVIVKRKARPPLQELHRDSFMSAICTARRGSSKQRRIPGYRQRPRKTPLPQDTRAAIHHALALLSRGPGTFVGRMNEAIRETRGLSPKETCLTGGYVRIHSQGRWSSGQEEERRNDFHRKRGSVNSERPNNSASSLSGREM